MKSLGLCLLLLYGESLFANCQQPGEATTLEVEENGTRFVKMVFCESKIGKPTPETVRCFKPDQLQRFLDSVTQASAPVLKEAVLHNLFNLGFTSKADAEKKLAAFKEKHPDGEVCPSGILTAGNEKKVRDSAAYFAQLYNFRNGYDQSIYLDAQSHDQGKAPQQR